MSGQQRSRFCFRIGYDETEPELAISLGDLNIANEQRTRPNRRERDIDQAGPGFHLSCRHHNGLL